jgi:hypothetical protein
LLFVFWIELQGKPQSTKLLSTSSSAAEGKKMPTSTSAAGGMRWSHAITAQRGIMVKLI